MRFWLPIELTSARRPLLLSHEVDIFVQDGVGLYEGRHKIDGYQNGRVYLTTHRLCYVDSSQFVTRSVAIDLSRVTRVQFTPRLLKSSPKLTLYFYSQSERLLTTQVGLNKLLTGNNDNQHASARLASWICPICSFSNSFKSSSIDHHSIPACFTCGIKPERSVLDVATQALQALDFSSNRVATADSDGFECARCTFINHPSLQSCEMCGANLISNNLPPALLKSFDDLHVYNPSASPGPELSPDHADDEDVNHVKISFRAGGEKLLVEKLKQVLQDQRWELHHRKPVRHRHHSSHQENVTLPKIGIHGLERLSVQDRRKNAELMDSLNDLNSLMLKAKEMVSLAENFALRLSVAPGVPIEARNALRESSKALGLSSPIVVREMAGNGGDNIFYAELARHIAEFLDSGVLVREGGILTLFDLFALYNRARGISLISPTDFYNACETIETLQLPFRLRKFRSGVVVVREAYFSDEKINNLIMTWLRDESQSRGVHVGVTAHEVNQKFGWSVTVGEEELDILDESARLCRDITVEGTRFYENLIATYAWDWRNEIFNEHGT
ncbi:EAP30/Vps36 family-domain-containing protein [Lipomyces japonicus]|uniref:EAP30/Vps36 family-domain-containing protein n=1 Tax=Lipomyces japonicus TaxID=56871 RepID=UPI0034CE45B8